jgi:hypothetical protein
MVKVQVKSLFMSEGIWGGAAVEAQFQSFLTSTLDGVEWSISHPGQYLLVPYK